MFMFILVYILSFVLSGLGFYWSREFIEKEDENRKKRKKGLPKVGQRKGFVLVEEERRRERRGDIRGKERICYTDWCISCIGIGS
jgi:hypothetical protein